MSTSRHAAGGGDPYLGRKEIVLFAHSVMSSLFPAPPVTLQRRLRVMPFPTWLAYVLYRTRLPDAAVFHALDLVSRLSVDFQCNSPVSPYSAGSEDDEDWDPTNAPELLHHRLLASNLILVASYWMEDAYTNKSWAAATRGYWDVSMINHMELSMLEAHKFSILDRAHGQTEDSLVAKWSVDYAAWRKDQHSLRVHEDRYLDLWSLRDDFEGRACGLESDAFEDRVPGRGRGYRVSSSGGLWVST